MKFVVFIVSWVLALVPLVDAQSRSGSDTGYSYIRSNYTKFEYFIPMRDGVKLCTEVYVPKDESRKYPILFLRTPYSVGPYGPSNYTDHLSPSGFIKDGYIFAYQDVRGRYESEGRFIDEAPHIQHPNSTNDVDPSTDSYDSIDWMVKNIPRNNGRVGMSGISYPGFYAAYSLINSHPALKADSPQAPMGDVGNGDDCYHNGAFFLSANFGFFTGFWPRGDKAEKSRRSRREFDFGTRDEYDFYLRMGPLSHAEDLVFKHQNEYWSDILAHPNYDDFWATRALGPNMHNLTSPVLLVGGWYDAEDLGGTLKLFHAIEEHGNAPGLTLVMGPWSHGQWGRGSAQKLGDLDFGSKTGEYYREQIQYPFFKQYLNEGPTTNFPKAWLFATGANEWKQFDAWPPKNTVKRSIYLQPGGKLSFTPPGGRELSEEYISNPNKPVPSMGVIGEGMPGDYMTYDQRFASERPDVLTYETDPLTEDFTIAGPVSPALRVSTSGTDSDFIVKLIDVFPNDMPDPEPNPKNIHFGGYQQMVRGEPFRGKFRNSMSNPEPFKPNKPAEINFDMPDVLHTFKKDHRIMVQIQSSWFPLTDRNPQKFEDIPTAKASDFVKATERVYYGGKSGTHIDVLELK